MRRVTAATILVERIHGACPADPAAEHGICVPPFRPTTDTVVPGPGVMLDLGGTPQDTAAAQQAAWAEILDFLKTHLQN
jgi:hypothetical protein